MAGYAGWFPVRDSSEADVPLPSLRSRIVTLVAASAGIGLWGGLLLYFLFREGIAAMGFG